MLLGAMDSSGKKCCISSNRLACVPVRQHVATKLLHKDSSKRISDMYSIQRGVLIFLLSSTVLLEIYF